MLAFATEAINQLAPRAPDNTANEAAIRLVGYLYEQPFATEGTGYANALRNSGAALMLAGYREIGVALAGSDAQPVALPGAVTSQELADAIAAHTDIPTAHQTIDLAPYVTQAELDLVLNQIEALATLQTIDTQNIQVSGDGTPSGFSTATTLKAGTYIIHVSGVISNIGNGRLEVRLQDANLRVLSRLSNLRNGAFNEFRIVTIPADIAVVLIAQVTRGNSNAQLSNTLFTTQEFTTISPVIADGSVSIPKLAADVLSRLVPSVPASGEVVLEAQDGHQTWLQIGTFLERELFSEFSGGEIPIAGQIITIGHVDSSEGRISLSTISANQPIADGAVTLAKLAAAIVARLLPSVIGSNGQVLTSDGSAASWQDATGGGGGDATKIEANTEAIARNLALMQLLQGATARLHAIPGTPALVTNLNQASMLIHTDPPPTNQNGVASMDAPNQGWNTNARIFVRLRNDQMRSDFQVVFKSSSEGDYVVKGGAWIPQTNLSADNYTFWLAWNRGIANLVDSVELQRGAGETIYTGAVGDNIVAQFAQPIPNVNNASTIIRDQSFMVSAANAGKAIDSGVDINDFAHGRLFVRIHENDGDRFTLTTRGLLLNLRGQSVGANGADIPHIELADGYYVGRLSSGNLWFSVPSDRPATTAILTVLSEYDWVRYFDQGGGTSIADGSVTLDKLNALVTARLLPETVGANNQILTSDGSNAIWKAQRGLIVPNAPASGTTILTSEKGVVQWEAPSTPTPSAPDWSLITTFSIPFGSAQYTNDGSNYTTLRTWMNLTTDRELLVTVQDVQRFPQSLWQARFWIPSGTAPATRFFCFAAGTNQTAEMYAWRFSVSATRFALTTQSSRGNNSTIRLEGIDYG